MYVCISCSPCNAGCLQKPEGGTIFSGTGVKNSYEPPYGRHLIPGPLEEQPVLLVAEPSLHFQIICFQMKVYDTK